MAQTDWASGLERSEWATTLFREVSKQIYFTPFMGKPGDKNAIIHVETTLEKKPGKDVTFGLIMKLTEDGVVDNQVLEGNEEAILSYSQTVTLTRRRHAVRDEGEFEDQKFMIKFRKEGRGVLSIWMAEVLNSACFTALSASPTRTLREDTAESWEINTPLATLKANLAAADVVTPAGISAAKRLAKIPAGSSEVKMYPVSVEGKMYYVMILHPDSMYDLAKDSTWTQAAREALTRGPDNPIFSGANYLWDGVVIHEHEDIPTADDGGGATIHWTQNQFLGRQALLFARCKRPKWVEKKFDYDDQVGIATAVIYAVEKATFNSEDHGAMSYCATASSFVAT